MWACLGLACVQCIVVAAAMMATWKKRREAKELQHQQQRQQQQLGTIQPPADGYLNQCGTASLPPTLLGDLATSGGYTPPPPPGGNPCNGTRSSGGYNPYTTPSDGNLTAPLLGGYVSSLAVPPGRAGTVLLGQSADVQPQPQQSSV